jgi:hypothetical protein
MSLHWPCCCEGIKTRQQLNLELDLRAAARVEKQELLYYFLFIISIN